ncbi:MAG: CoA pyrophosphatase [Pseudonocardiales bacterium]|nr:MAG: CoA pyrophosphatase [Pseudonocardiales bacterium]
MTGPIPTGAARPAPLETGPLVDPRSLPGWLDLLVRRTAEIGPGDLGRIPVPRVGGRPAAVLVLLAEDSRTGEPDVLLQMRSQDLSAHPGQVCFPGGAAEDGDDGPVATALREAVEEVGIRADDVRPIAVLPQQYLPPSDFVVTPVLGYWERPGAVAPVDYRETVAVARVLLRVLAEPSNRLIVRGPSGYPYPAFVVPGMLVWGFTGGLLAALLTMGGWARPWEPAAEYDLDAARRLAERTEVIR